VTIRFVVDEEAVDIVVEDDKGLTMKIVADDATVDDVVEVVEAVEVVYV
jgi:hypothetical protein